jgi:hypothetical protein
VSLQTTLSLVANSSGAASSNIIPPNSQNWQIYGIGVTSKDTQPLSATVEFMTNGNLQGVSYFPFSDIGAGTIYLNALEVLSVNALDCTAGSTITVTVYYNLETA